MVILINNDFIPEFLKQMVICLICKRKYPIGSFIREDKKTYVVGYICSCGNIFYPRTCKIIYVDDSNDRYVRLTNKKWVSLAEAKAKKLKINKKFLV